MKSKRRKALRVLYVGDNLGDVKLYGEQLEQAGFELSTEIVASAAESVSALRSKSFDIVFADYRLRGCSGIEALEALQREGQDIPFILLSGTIGEEEAVECIKRGATDYVLKDRPARLSLAVQRALDERIARQERARAERSRDLLAAIVESSEDAIIGVTFEGTIVSWNGGAARIFGYPAEEILERPFSLLVAAEGAEDLRSIMENLRGGKSTGRHETRGAKKGGDPIDIALTMSPIREANGFAGVGGVAAAIARDITEQKRLQREFLLAQKMETVGRLAAGVAHDFNNLLTVIAGYSTEVLGELSEHDPLHEKVREIQKAGERAATLTRRLLAFSRGQILQPRVLDLNAIVADMDHMLRRVIGEDIDLVTVLDPELASVRADPGQIEQVIMNLAVNARDAMPKGGKLAIETANVDLSEDSAWRRHPTVKPGQYAMLAMTDNGCGMDPETQARIFEPFFTTKGQGKGTGLGLSTVYGIVEQSGGAIFVYGEPGRGTTFKVYLPRVEGVPAAVEAPDAVSSPSGSETILVVEDEGAVRRMVCRILQKQGYTVLPAPDGEAALLVCERHDGRIHLLVSDVVMAGMSGSDLAARLAKQCPEMKMLFMSGYTDNAVIHQGVLTQEIAFLQKPFPPRVLARKVREVLDRAG